MANPSYTYTLTNGTTADADQVMQNFNDILNGVTDGTKDISVAALTAAGTATFNGNVTLGNAAADDITVTGSLTSSIPIKTDASFDIGSSTLGLRRAYFGGNSNRVGIGASGSTSATYNLTLPTTAGTAGYVLSTNGSGVTSWLGYATTATPGLISDTAQIIPGAKTFDSAAKISYGDGAPTTPQLLIENTTATDSAADAWIEFRHGANGNAGKIVSSRSGNYSGTTTNDAALLFYTAADDAYINPLGLSSTGAVTIGVSSGTATHGVEGPVFIDANNITAASYALSIRKQANDTTSSQNFISFGQNDTTANSGRIAANGANAAAFQTTSDARLKTAVVPLDGGLDVVNALRPVEFEWIEHPGTKVKGFIAQEVLPIVPDAVSTFDVDGENYYSMCRENFIPYIIAAIKELSDKIDGQ